MTINSILHYKTYGNGKTILILHGFLGLGDNWVGHARLLSSNYRVIVPDMRNHGKSFHHPEMNYELMQQDVFHLCLHLNIDKACIIGHSMGGKTAMILADRHPELVDKLVIVDIAPSKNDMIPKHDELLKAIAGIDFSTMTDRTKITDSLNSIIFEKRIVQFLLKSIQRNKLGQYEWKFNFNVLSAQLNRIMEDIDVTGNFKGPVLLIRGELSNYVTEHDIHTMGMIYPQMIDRSISGATHWVHADKPAEFYAEISDFIKYG